MLSFTGERRSSWIWSCHAKEREMQLLVTTGPVYAPESQFCNEKILENSDMTGLEWGGVL